MQKAPREQRFTRGFFYFLFRFCGYQFTSLISGFIG